MPTRAHRYAPAIDPTSPHPFDRTALVRALHDHPARLVIAVAGGGNALITDVLDVPGASRTVLEVVVPYADTAMADFVRRPGEVIESIVSDEHAIAMAEAARRRALDLAPGIDRRDLFGLVVTAALVTDRPKRGDHRAHVALAGIDGVDTRRVDLEKGAHDRSGEDRIVADAALLFVAELLCLDGGSPIGDQR